MENSKVSIIVPVYKVEQYLDKCVQSIVDQTYKNLEIILVDDGSPDNCPKMCDEWSKKDSRIKVIHKENGGVSSARNAGLDIATGEYVQFVDSDDVIRNDMCEKLLINLIELDADVSVCNWEKVQEQKIQSKNCTKQQKITIYEGDKVFELIFNHKVPLIMALWTKLYKKKIFKNIRFPIVEVAEDDAIIHKVLAACKKLCYNDEKLYFYTQRNTGLTKMRFSMKKLRSLHVFKDRIEFVSKEKPQFLDTTIKHYLKILVLYYYRAKWSKLDPVILEKIKEEITLYTKKGYKNKITWCFKYCPCLLECALKLREKFI